MGLFKIVSQCLMLTVCSASYLAASEILTERNPNTPHLKNEASSHQSPVKLPPVKPQANYKTLKIDHPLEEHELGQLMDRDCREIYLLGVYVGYEKNGSFLKKTSLTISPDVINPDVEVLSLKCCGITDDLIKRVGEFKKLKKLILVSNHLTDASITSISRLEKLESLSLALNDISNISVPFLLAIPSLIELNLSHNKEIDNSVSEIFLANNTLKKLDVRFTGLGRPEQRRIEKKYEVIKP